MLHQTVKMLKEGLQISLQSFQFYFIILQIFSLLLLLFLPVPGWCDPVFRFKGFGENSGSLYPQERATLSMEMSVITSSSAA